MNEVDDYLNNITINVLDAKDKKIQIIGIEQIDSFFKKEHTFWTNEAFRKCNNSNIQTQGNNSERWISAIKEFKSEVINPNINNNEKLRYIQGVWTQKYNSLEGHLRNRSLLFSDSLEAQYFKTISGLPSNEIDVTWNYFFNKTTNNFNTSNKNIFKAYLRAYEFERGLENGISGIVSAEQNRMKEAIEELNSKTNEAINSSIAERNRVSGEWTEEKKKIQNWESETKTHFETNNKEINGKLEALIAEHVDKLKDIEDTYTRKLELEKPIKLWEKRVRNYKNQSLLWFVILSGASIGSIFLLLWILKKEPHAIFREGGTFMVDPSAIFGVIVVATIVSFAAFLVRISAKIALSSMHLSRDAEEREQLTRVYLGLKMEGNVDISSESLILDALFSRAQTGLLKEDSAPTMPGVDAALKKLIK